ncbi:MAG: rod shape-determining protein MreC [Halobacteriovoraceae bacterium]|nr:rod shape-determining protein MreC [Halobacteriovoraceae bacterium]
MNLSGANSQRAKVLINTSVLLWSLFFVTRRATHIQKTSAFENFMVDSFAPLQKGVSVMNVWTSDKIDHYVTNIDASKDNVDLRQTISKLNNKIFQLDEIARENKRLKKLLEFGVTASHRKVLAQIVAWDSSSDFKIMRINKGLKAGIRLQSSVVTADGLVGYVYRLTENFADILTITDANNRVDGIVERVRAHGILEGRSHSKCQMKYVTRTEPIILNDQVITSGLGNIYPKGIKIGTVSRIERESYGITQRIEVSPSVDFSRVEEVIVLVSSGNAARQQEWSALDGKGSLGRK